MAKKLPINGGYPLHTFEQLEEVYSQYITEEKDKNMIRDAYDFILAKHMNQTRRTGEPYYHHLLEVAYILAKLQAGPSTITAGLLHDVVEDTDVTVEEIKQRWGEQVAKLVDSLTKIQRLKLSRMQGADFEAEDHRKIFIGMAKDIRVIIIKLADRLHNMRTLAALSPERQIAISKETMDVFVPIASRLGLDAIKCELSDLCLKYLEPEKYEEINKLLAVKTKYLSKSLSAFKKKLADILFEHQIPFEITARVKSISSIYEKMYIKGRSFDAIYDILALRIITETELQCYEILGLIHSVYAPVPGRFKDYIAMPKTNLYQSLHTTVVSGDGNFYEVQIRTKEMDEIAEAGVAAHWAYKEHTGYNPDKEQKEIEDKLHWFRDFVSISKESADESASEYMKSLTKDIFEANVYVFTPTGKVIELPAGSTPIDFAYRIHTKVGDTAVGALVNGVMVPLYTILKTGEMVEIKTSKNSGPSEGWLDFVRTNLARTQIKKYLAKKNAEQIREERLQKGKQSLIDAFKDRGVDEAKCIELVSQEKVLQNFGFETVEDLYVGVASRKPVPSAVIEFLRIKKPVVIKTTQKKIDNSKCPVYCNGADRIAINLSSCCTPIPGDEIIGYITRGKGISVHRKECPNVANEKERLIDVFWKENIEYSTYPVDLLVEANDRPNLLVDIMNAMSSAKVTLSAIHAQLQNHNRSLVVVNLTPYVSDAKKLNDITNILLNIKGVYGVKRAIH